MVKKKVAPKETEVKKSTVKENKAIQKVIDDCAKKYGENALMRGLVQYTEI